MHLSKVLTAGLAILLVSASAWADPMLELSSGGSTVTITDNQAGDSSPFVGVVSYNGAVGGFFVNITTGITKPVIGSEEWPKLHLNSVNVSGSAGTIEIKFTDTDFMGIHSGFVTSGGGISGGTVMLESYADDGNAPFAESTSLNTLAFGTGLFAGTDSAHAALSAPYSLTLVATITHGSSFAVSSFDAELTAPEPSTMVLMGAALAGAFAIRRRRRKTA